MTTPKSGKERLRLLLLELADHRGRVHTGSLELSRILGLGVHETVHLLWALQKAGFITHMREDNSRMGDIRDIRIRKGQ